LNAHRIDVAHNSTYLLGTRQREMQRMLYNSLELEKVKCGCNWCPSYFLKLLENITSPNFRLNVQLKVLLYL